MRKFSKEFWRGLLVTVIILGTVYSCTIYLALKERGQKEEWRKRDEERRERIRLGQDAARRYTDSIRRSVRVKSTMGNSSTAKGYDYDDSDPYDDPYDDPYFDDLIPGDEYDEEFIDRSTGDPELYENP